MGGVDIDRADPLAFRARPLVDGRDPLLHFSVWNQLRDGQERTFLAALLVAEAEIAVANPADDDRRVTVGAFGHGWKWNDWA